jgi:hypothetical protein
VEVVDWPGRLWNRCVGTGRGGSMKLKKVGKHSYGRHRIWVWGSGKREVAKMMELEVSF